MNNSLNKTMQISGESNLLISTAETGLTENEKINIIEFHFSKIMETLGLDLNDHNLKETPFRVAKMYVTEIFEGLNKETFPKISLFDNTYEYNEMLIEKGIQVYSYCERHFLPFIGKAHVAYIPGKKVIGLSKINRIVKYFARRPQVQERLTIEISNALKNILQTDDVAVYIEAKHLCVSARGVEDTNSVTVTTCLCGRFSQSENKDAFYAAFKGRP